eukprot:XP_025003520.1 36.4 kDa proline-rich protein-like [Gallus gallus]
MDDPLARRQHFGVPLTAVQFPQHRPHNPKPPAPNPTPHSSSPITQARPSSPQPQNPTFIPWLYDLQGPFQCNHPMALQPSRTLPTHPSHDSMTSRTLPTQPSHCSTICMVHLMAL